MNHPNAERYGNHLAAEAMKRAVHSVTIGYRLTLTGAPPVGPVLKLTSKESFGSPANDAFWATVRRRRNAVF